MLPQYGRSMWLKEDAVTEVVLQVCQPRPAVVPYFGDSTSSNSESTSRPRGVTTGTEYYTCDRTFPGDIRSRPLSARQSS